MRTWRTEPADNSGSARAETTALVPVRIEHAGPPIPGKSVARKLAATSFHRLILRQPLEKLDHGGAQAARRSVHKGMKYITADAFVGILGELQKPVPHRRHVALDVARTQVPDRGSADACVCVEREFEHLLGLRPGTAFTSNRKFDTSVVTDHLDRSRELAHDRKFTVCRTGLQADCA